MKVESTLKERFKLGTDAKGKPTLIRSDSGPLCYVRDIQKLVDNLVTHKKQLAEEKKQVMEQANTRLRNARKSHVTEGDAKKLYEWWDSLEVKPEDFPVEIFGVLGGVFDFNEDDLEDGGTYERRI